MPFGGSPACAADDAPWASGSTSCWGVTWPSDIGHGCFTTADIQPDFLYALWPSQCHLHAYRAAAARHPHNEYHHWYFGCASQFQVRLNVVTALDPLVAHQCEAGDQRGAKCNTCSFHLPLLQYP